MSDLDDKLMDPTRSLQRVQVKACQCVVCEKEDGSLMCGQCYYDRFEKELNNKLPQRFPEYFDALEAAKKASGLK